MLAGLLDEIGGMRLLRARAALDADADAGATRWSAEPGRVRARVTGSQGVYAVQLDLEVLPLAPLAAKLRGRPVWAGRLLSGRLPEALVAEVVPQRLRAITPQCSCPDGVSWCKHAMATLLAVDAGGVGALLAWRGVSRAALVAALYPAAEANPDTFWTGGPLPRPRVGGRPVIQEMPALDIHGTPIQTVLDGSVARVQRAAHRLMTGQGEGKSWNR